VFGERHCIALIKIMEYDGHGVAKARTKTNIIF
jgi:hypothetical protein